MFLGSLHNLLFRWDNNKAVNHKLSPSPSSCAFQSLTHSPMSLERKTGLDDSWWSCYVAVYWPLAYDSTVCVCVWISSARPPTVQSFYPPVFPSDFSTSQYIFSAVHGTEMLLDVSNTLLFSTSHWREPQLPFKYWPSYALPHCLLSYSSSFLSRLNELNWTETVLLYHWT